MKRNRAGKGIVLIILFIVSVLTLLPFFWILVTSVKNIGDVVVNGPLAMPKTIRWDNYIKICMPWCS